MLFDAKISLLFKSAKINAFSHFSSIPSSRKHFQSYLPYFLPINLFACSKLQITVIFTRFCIRVPATLQRLKKCSHYFTLVFEEVHICRTHLMFFCYFTYTNHNVLFRNQSRISNPSALPHQEDISIQRRKKPQNGPFKKGSSTLLNCCERLPIYDKKMNLVFSLACSLHYFRQSAKCVKMYRLIAQHDRFIAM